MNRLATALLTLGLLTAAIPAWSAQGDPADPDPAMRFGMDANSIAAQTAAGAAPDYGTFWVGPWTLKHGWSGPDAQMASMQRQGVTPAIHFYYWGDDISQSCIENGCYSSLHGAQKDKAGWNRLADELVVHLNSQMKGDEVVIFVETEFNKADVQNYEPLDGYLAEKAERIKAGYPNAHIVLSLGSWNAPAWKTWDRAAAASDAIGIQGMRGSTRDSLSHYQSLYETTVKNAGILQDLFGKPIFIQDIALSTYPEPEYIGHQKAELQQFFDGIPELKALGVEAMLYRSWRNTNMDLANYYGQAERHWGFAYQDGTWKPSAQVWISGVQAERADAAPAPEATIPPFEPQFKLGNVNSWWVDVRVNAATPVASVQAVYEGTPHTLSKTSWGTFAKSFHAPPGGEMVFVAKDTHGQEASSEPMVWLADQVPPPPPPNTAPRAVLDANVSDLTVRLDGSGSSDAEGDALTYTYTLGDGTAKSGAQTTHTYAKAGTYTVAMTVSDGNASNTTQVQVTVQAPAFSATFEPSKNVNAWWVDVKVRSSAAPAKVEASVNGGPLVQLDQTNWGTFAKSFSAPRGEILFKATDAHGQVATQKMAWLGGPAPSPSPSPSPSPAPQPFAADFSVKGNTWWVEAKVDATSTVTKVEASVNGGAFVPLDKTSWGTYAKSFHAPAGSIVLRATSASGQVATSEPMDWQKPTFSATFTPKTGNVWWVETKVDANQGIAKVEASINGGAYKPLKKTDWGTYADSFNVGKNGKVQFRAISVTGDTAQSGTILWA